MTKLKLLLLEIVKKKNNYERIHKLNFKFFVVTLH